MRRKLAVLAAVEGAHGPAPKTGARSFQAFDLVRRLAFTDEDAAGAADQLFGARETLPARGMSTSTSPPLISA